MVAKYEMMKGEQGISFVSREKTLRAILLLFGSSLAKDGIYHGT